MQGCRVQEERLSVLHWAYPKLNFYKWSWGGEKVLCQPLQSETIVPRLKLCGEGAQSFWLHIPRVELLTYWARPGGEGVGYGSNAIDSPFSEIFLNVCSSICFVILGQPPQTVKGYFCKFQQLNSCFTAMSVYLPLPTTILKDIPLL